MYFRLIHGGRRTPRTSNMHQTLCSVTHAGMERPDLNLLVRARLVRELDLLAELTTAMTQADKGAVDVLTTALRRLDDDVHSERSDDYRRTSLAPITARPPGVAPPLLVVEEGEEDLPSPEPEDPPTAG